MMPLLYIPHGGGPMPLLGDKNHLELSRFLKNLMVNYPNPESILVVSAHWEENTPTLIGGKNPGLEFDYYGFPKESYSIEYSALGAQGLVEEIKDIFEEKGHRIEIDDNRSFDHGMFVPLKLMYPFADIPCTQISLVRGLDAKTHFNLGELFGDLSSRNVLIIGSGMSFHNMGSFFSKDDDDFSKSLSFDNWLNETICSSAFSMHERSQRLINWEKAPFAKFAHPREEHLIPLMFCLGVASISGQKGERNYNGTLFNRKISGFMWK